ncbi:hypothetical protein LCGC14_2455420, partial [marine sediment metagenome]
ASIKEFKDNPCSEYLCGLCMQCDDGCRLCPLVKGYLCCYSVSPYSRAVKAWTLNKPAFAQAACEMFDVLIEVSPYKSEKEWLEKMPKKYRKFL